MRHRAEPDVSVVPRRDLRRVRAHLPRLAEEFAVQYVDARQIYDCAGQIFVAAVQAEPLLDEEYVYVPVVDVTIDAADEITSLAHTILGLTDSRRLRLRVDPGSTPPGSGWSLVARYLVKQAPTPTMQPIHGGTVAGVHIAPVDSETAQFVRRQLGLALIEGYAPVVLDRLKLEQFTELAYRFDGTDGLSSLVAFEGAEPVGHVTAQVIRDDVTGLTYTDVIDVAVVASHERRGIANRLTGEMASRLSGEGRIRGNVLALRGALDTTLMANLTGALWEPLYDLWELTADSTVSPYSQR